MCRSFNPLPRVPTDRLSQRPLESQLPSGDHGLTPHANSRSARRPSCIPESDGPLGVPIRSFFFSMLFLSIICLRWGGFEGRSFVDPISTGRWRTLLQPNPLFSASATRHVVKVFREARGWKRLIARRGFLLLDPSLPFLPSKFLIFRDL